MISFDSSFALSTRSRSSTRHTGNSSRRSVGDSILTPDIQATQYTRTRYRRGETSNLELTMTIREYYICTSGTRDGSIRHHCN